jgi:AmmeMemoRadiSam system protein B
MRDVRPAAVAGSWYPGNREKLAAAVDTQVAAAAHVDAPPCPRALVAPHAGLPYSGPVAAHAYRLARKCPYAAVVLVGPSHFVTFRGVAIWPRGAWESPLGDVTIAEDLARDIAAQSRVVVEHPAAHGREHSLEMQLPFLARVLPGIPIVPLVMGYQNRATAFALGDSLAGALKTHGAGDVLLVASSDLSHYESADTASALDAVVLKCVQGLDAEALMNALEHEPRHACGGGPMVSVIRAASLLGCTQARVLAYADSGDVSGDKSSVVGYMAAAIW